MLRNVFFTRVLSSSKAKIYEGVSKSNRTGRLERELQMVISSLPLGAVVSLFCEPV